MNKTDGSCFIYILRCADGAYYVGSTTALAARLDTHNAGRGPRFTASRRPVTLLYSEPFPTLAQARKREIQIKKWSRAKKQALIAGDIQKLHELSCHRTRCRRITPSCLLDLIHRRYLSPHLRRHRRLATPDYVTG